MSPKLKCIWMAERMERVERYDYLEPSVNCFVDYCSEIKIPIEKGLTASKIKMLLCIGDLSLNLRTRTLNVTYS